MTVVHQVVDGATGQLLEVDRAAAERRAERIGLRLDAIADNYVAVMPMIRESVAKRDDLALGYASPGAYVQDRFGGALQRLGVDVRRAVVHELTAAGMSTRAIAPVVGVSQKTVARDAQVSHMTHLPQTIAPVEDHDTAAPSRQPTSPSAQVQGTPAAHDDEVPTGAGDERRQTAGVADARDHADEAVDAPPAPVIGLDGKRYQSSRSTAPSTQRRRPLPDAFFSATYDLTKRVESLVRLVQDDRFPQNADKVASKHRSDLVRARDALQRVLEMFPTDEESTDDRRA